VPPPEGDGTGAGTDHDVEYWKQRARQHEDRAKANADAAKKLAELESANKTEIQRAQDEAAAAKEAAIKSELRAVRAEVAQAAGLTVSQARRLVGETKDELEADAKELVKDLGAGKKPADLKQGARGPSTEPDADAWLRRMAHPSR
jgi:type IV secretory pathway TrbL component